MRIAITGGMGFIGSEVVRLLDGSGHGLIIVDFWDDLLREYERQRYPIIEQTYRNLAIAEEVMRPDDFIVRLRSLSPDVIVHLGAIVNTTDLGSHDMVDQNVGYVRDLVGAANDGRVGVKSAPGIIFASSASTYGSDFTRPNNPYGLMKVFGERLVASSLGQYVNLRLFNVFGAMEHHKLGSASLPFKISQAYARGDRFDMHSPFVKRDFISVTAVARVISRLIDDMGSMQGMKATYDVGTGKATGLVDLDGMIMDSMQQVSSCIREVPIPDALVGRYQGYTCGGVGPVPLLDCSQDTRTGIEEQYGLRSVSL